MATVKLKIAELRKDKGISQQDIADVLGVSFQSEESNWRDYNVFDMRQD
jgi:transcriptional regulator with XRE-family HTH domain